MVLSQVSVGFEKLNEALGLPPDTKVVGVKENEWGNVAVFKIVGPREPVNISLKPEDDLRRLGEAYVEGAVGEPLKGTTRGANPEPRLVDTDTQD
jgi:hypothetical protein